jgi:hypothetical protein
MLLRNGKFDGVEYELAEWLVECIVQSVSFFLYPGANEAGALLRVTARLDRALCGQAAGESLETRATAAEVSRIYTYRINMTH